MSIDKVQVNGDAFDWGSITILAANDTLHGIKSIKYKDGIESSFQYGASRARAPRGRTRGKYTCEASMTLFKDSAHAFRQRLHLLSGGRGYGQVDFNVNLQFFENGSDFQNILLVNCRYGGTDASDEENTDSLTEDIALRPFYIVRNGLVIFEVGDGQSIAGVIGGLVTAVAGFLG